MTATDLTPNFPAPKGTFDPDDRFSIYVVAMENRADLLRNLAAAEPNLPEAVIEETLDETTDKSFLLPSAENKFGFLPFSGGDPTEDLCKHLFTRTRGQLRNVAKRHNRQVQMADEVLTFAAPAADDVVAQVEQRALLADLANSAPEVMEYAVARANGTTEAEFTQSGISNNKRNAHHKRLRAIREDWRAYTPVAIFLRLIHGSRGGEVATAASGAGAGTAATVGGGAIAAKVGAVCAAGVLCAGVVVQGVNHHKSDKSRTDASVTKSSPAPKHLYTAIPPSVSSTRRTKQTTAAKAATRKQADARKRAASRRQTVTADNEFGVEAGSSGSNSASSGSSGESQSSSSSNSQEFGVEAGP